MKVKFNINYYVWVKLTEAGHDRHRQLHDEFLKDFPLDVDYKPVYEDSDGWSKWQMHNLMLVFGDRCWNGNNKLPFETTILIEDDDTVEAHEI